MASTQLLASKVVILEEEPQIPAITALPSAVALATGITERGPIADPILVTSFDEYTKTFGGFTLDSEVALAAHGFFYNGGGFMWVSRTVHFTDLTDPNTAASATGTLMLLTSGGSATAGSLSSTLASPYALAPADTLVIAIDGAADQTATFNATVAAPVLAGPFPIAALVAGDNMTIAIDGGTAQTITAVGAEASALDVANLINAQLNGGRAYVVGATVLVESDTLGTGSEVVLAAGAPDMLAKVVGTPGTTSGTGNVVSIASVTGAEVKTIVEAAVAGSGVTVNGDSTVTIASATLGATSSIQVQAASTADTKMGLDNTLHSGAASAPQNTLKVDGKTPGAYTDDITILIEDATNGEAEQFNLTVLVSGVTKEVYPNLVMGTGANPEDIINLENLGSDLIAVTDQSAAGGELVARPVNGTFGALAGGDDGITLIAASDYLGNAAGPTGLYAFDLVSSGRILLVPGNSDSTVLLGMMDYAESWRNGSMIAVLDCPEAQTAAQMVTFVNTNGLLEYSEFGVIYWPWIKVVNPSTSVFGDDDTLAVAPSGWIAGKYASNDQKLGGVYESPAGIGGSFGIIRGMVGVEDAPSGTDRHPVLDERVRDLVYPYRINPITKLDSTPWHIDGGRTLKSTGNFPNVGERRGVIFIEQSLKEGLIILKHRFNNRANRQRAKRIITAFLIREMNKGAFRSTNPEEAFFVDVSDQLNPPVNEFAGIMTIRVGLATNKPGEYIVILITQDTRALAESLAV